jgi:hypothetical protein
VYAVITGNRLIAVRALTKYLINFKPKGGDVQDTFIYFSNSSELETLPKKNCPVQKFFVDILQK